MSAQISLQPMATTNANGLFNTNSQGYTQGDAQDDPAVKFALAGGYLGSSVTTPVWGGMPITEEIPPVSSPLGSTIVNATDLSGAASTGILVYNQAFNGITTPQSTAPLFSAGMTVNFYRFGSGARIPLPCDSTVVSLDGSSIAETVYWNYSTNILTATQPVSGQAALPVKIIRVSTSGNKVVSYNGTTGNANWTSTLSDGVTPAAVAVVLI
jgi:hypothetical protein